MGSRNIAMEGPTDDYAAMTTGFYGLTATRGDGELFQFEALKGKVVLIVNVASLCGFTPQYNELQRLYERYHDQGLEILAFPCNQFGNQEPGSHEEIIRFTRETFHVTFTILGKVDVNGPDEVDVYKYIKNEKRNILGLKGVKWNFEKFLVDRRGNVVNRYLSTKRPLSIETRIKELLDEDVR